MKPLVSVICPTLASRAAFLPRAIRCFLAQDYPNLEMIIVGESGPLAVRVEEGRRILWAVDPGNIGSARNTACRLASGEYIVHFDDDDYSASDRVSHQIAALEESAAALVAYSSVLCEEMRTVKVWTAEGKRPASKWWRWTFPNSGPAGLSFCYRRDWWAAHPFPDVAAAEDDAFLAVALQHGKTLFIDGGEHLIATNHVGNGSGRLVGGIGWEESVAPLQCA